MMLSIADLTNARPHMRKTARFSPPEFRAYCEGYYWGVVMAAKVAALAAERFKANVKARIADARQKRKAS